MIETLGFETDNAGETVEVKSSDSVLVPTLYSFYLIHYAELITNGFASPMSKIDFSNGRAVFVEKNNKTVGIIFYDCQFVQDRKYATIMLSAIDPSQRRMGIYKILHRYLEDEIKKLGCEYLTSYVWKTNNVRLQTLQSVGLNPDYLLFGKRI
jgi:ribosomal protein S18 acetylase RimI-like enzyme